MDEVLVVGVRKLLGRFVVYLGKDERSEGRRVRRSGCGMFCEDGRPVGNAGAYGMLALGKS